MTSAVTPLRPTPGNFFETPGPSRAPPIQPPAFGPARSTFAQPQQQQQPPPQQQQQQNGAPVGPAQSQAAQQTGTQNLASAMTPAQKAARSVNDTLALDARFPDLDTYLIQGTSADYDSPSSPAMAPFQRVRSFEIPDRIFEQYNQAQMNTMMGLFAEIHHAWVAIDNALYIWDYTAPNPDLVGFEEQPHSINAVKLVKPRAGIFVATITHLLVVATQHDVLLIGLSAEKSSAGIFSVKMYSTNMQVSVKGCDVGSIVGSDRTGRIFFGGRATNDVYELVYKQEETWFMSRCRKINHTNPGLVSVVPSMLWTSKNKQEFVQKMEIDDTRNLVYTLSNKGTIRAFHMTSSDTLNLAVTRSLESIKQNIGHMVRDPGPILSKSDSIAAISPISAREASRITLMATTTTGCRIYLSATSSYYYSSDAGAPPSSMQVHHVKYPPPAEPQQPATRSNPETASAARFPPGYSFFLSVATNVGAPSDTLVITAPDAGRIATLNRPSDALVQQQPGGRFAESTMSLPLGSQAEDIGLITPPFAASRGPVGFGNELATQFSDDSSAAEVAVLTSTGVITFRRRRMVDLFASLIRTNRSSEDVLETAVTSFVRRYGRAETMASALAVCCGQAVDVSGDGGRVASVTEPDVIDSARKVYISLGGKATLIENGILGTSAAVNVDSVRPSPRFEGMVLYVSRILRSIWKSPILKETPMPTIGISVSCTFPLERLRGVQKDLNALREFLNQNKIFIEGLAGPESNARASSKQEEVALQGEHRAFTGLLKLVVDVVEGVAFVLVLFDDNRAEAILGKLDEKNRADVRNLTFEGLFTSDGGKDLAKALVKAIVNSNIEAGSNVETVAEALRRKCGSFCSAEDVMVFKAQEMLNRATNAGTESEVGRSQLNDSYTLFTKIAASLRMEVLKQATDSYSKLEFWAGAIQLVLDVAKASDPANRASSWVRDGEPKDDVRQALFEKRKECYNIIHDIIAAVDNSRMAADFRSPVRDRRVQEAYNVIDNSEDELFLSNLYDWYLEKGWSDRLLDLTSKYVVSYLQRKSLEDVNDANLLWRYYAHHARYFEAATVQLQLAKSNFDLNLSQRIEYLSRAKANASTRVPGMGSIRGGADSLRGLGAASRQGRQELLRDIGDLLDLASIQEDLLGRLKVDPRMRKSGPERAAQVEKDLNGEIKSLQDLYHRYVDQASYYDLTLQIYQIADHREGANIESTWKSMLSSTHEDAVRALEQANNTTAAPPLPWEAVSERVRSVAQKLQGSEAVMPPRVVVDLLATYYVNSVQPNRDNDPGVYWLPELLLSLQPPMPFESLLPALEQVFFSNERLWTLPKPRQTCAAWIVYVCDKWFAECIPESGELFGGEDNAVGVIDTLRAVEASGALRGDYLEVCAGLRGRIEARMR